MSQQLQQDGGSLDNLLPFQDKADDLKRAARTSMGKLRAAVEERAPAQIVQTANRIENLPQVQGLLNLPVPIELFVCALAVKTLTAWMFARGMLSVSSSTMLVLQFCLDLVLVAAHVWLNGSQRGKRRIKLSKDAIFEFTPVLTTTTTTDGGSGDASPPLGTFTPASSLTKVVDRALRPKVDKMVCKDADPLLFKVRQLGYSKTKAKASSTEALYELVGMDLLRGHVSNLASTASSSLASNALFSALPKHSRDSAALPNLLVVNAQIPDKPPSMFASAGSKKQDAGYSLVFYFHLREWAVRDQNTSPAVRLFKRYVKEHRTTPDVRRRMKAIGMVDNVQDLGALSSLVDTYNGKPAIINKTASIYHRDDCFELDISIYDFPYLPLRGLSSLKDIVAVLGLRAGFVLQGEADDTELPEVLLGGAEFCIDFAQAVAHDL